MGEASPASEDIYALLGVERTATDAEIKKAYRQQSRKYHPDRNPDNPNAESLFNTLKQGADLLLDPAQRAEYDKKYAAEKARKERFAALDNKRKAGLANLEEREKEFKKQQMDRERTVNQAAQVEMLKGEAARKRQERQRLAEQEQQQRQQQQQDALKAQNRGSTASQSAAGVHDLGPLDTTLLLSFPKALFPDGDAVRSQLSACAPTSAIDNVVYSDKKPKKNNKSSAPLQAKAVVALNTLAATIAIYKAMSKPESAKQGVEVKWASKDPPALARKALGLDKQEQQRPFVDASLDKPQESHQQTKAAPDESDILRRMAERQRLEDEIRKSEASDV